MISICAAWAESNPHMHAEYKIVSRRKGVADLFVHLSMKDWQGDVIFSINSLAALKIPMDPIVTERLDEMAIQIELKQGSGNA